MLELFFLAASHFLAVINTTSIKILLPEIMIDLQVGVNWLTWAVNAFSLSFAILLPICGRLGDIFGSRKFFLLGLFLFAAGSFASGLSPTFAVLVLSRILHAVGAAMVVPTSLALLMARTPKEKRGYRLGIWSSIGASGAVAGPVLAGMLLEVITWRGTYYVIAILAFLIMVISYKSFSSPKDASQEKEKPPFDLKGSMTLMLASSSFLMAITLLPDWGLSNFFVQLFFISFLVFSLLFIKIELNIKQPLFDLRKLKVQRFSLGLTAGFLEQFVVAGTMFLLPIFMGNIRGNSPLEIALLLAPAAATVSFVSPLGGKLSDGFGPGLPICIGMSLRGLSFFLLSYISLSTNYIFIAACLVLNGLGFGLTHVPALNAVLSVSNSSDIGVSSGLHNMIRYIGAAVGTTLCGIILYAYMPAVVQGTAGPIEGFRQALLFCSFSCLFGVLVGFKLFLGEKQGNKNKEALAPSKFKE